MVSIYIAAPNTATLLSEHGYCLGMFWAFPWFCRINGSGLAKVHFLDSQQVKLVCWRQTVPALKFKLSLVCNGLMIPDTLLEI